MMPATTHTTAQPRRPIPGRRLLTLACTVGLFLAMLAGPASAKGEGLTADTLTRAGWLCIDQAGHLPTPCIAHGEAVLAGEANSSIIVTFGPDGEEFWGTELLLHEELYNGQPCPQDQVSGGDGGYLDLEPLIGIPYYVCHHFDSPVT